MACGTNPTWDNRTRAHKRSIVIKNSKCSRFRITVMVASKIPSTRIVVSSTVTLRRLNLSVTATTNPNSRHRSQERCSDKESGHLSVDSVIIYLECKSSSFLIRRPSRTQWCLRKRTLKFLTSSIVRAKTFFTLKFLLITTSSRIWHLSEIKQATLPSYSPHNHSFALLSVAETTLKTCYSGEEDWPGIKSLTLLKS